MPSMSTTAFGRVFASHYQLRITDDPSRSLADSDNWSEGSRERGFAGDRYSRMVGTEVDLNDHWVELEVSISPPDLKSWDRVICCSFCSDTGKIHIMSVVDVDPVISADIGAGDFSLFVAANNIGVDQLSLEEDDELSEEQISNRKDLEWYRIFVVKGDPERIGIIKDESVEDRGTQPML